MTAAAGPDVELRPRTHRPKWAAPITDVRVAGEYRGVVIHLTDGTFEACRCGNRFQSPYSTFDEAVTALTEAAP